MSPFRTFPRPPTIAIMGMPKNTGGGPARFDSAIWEAARWFAGITHRRIRRWRPPPGSWCCGRAQSPGPPRPVVENSVLGDSERVHPVQCSKPTAPAARAEDVDMVFLTGGSSFVPAVRRIFETRFGVSRIRTGNEFTSVARGLAVKAADRYR